MPAQELPTAVGIKRRACVNCTAGKAKCSPFSNSICERCQRLGKNCVYLAVASKRKSPNSNSRVHLLERKVNGLVALLATKESQNTAKNSSANDSSLTDSEVLRTCQSFDSPESSEGTGNPASQTPLSGLDSGDIFDLDFIDRGLVSIETAQALLNLFRTKAVQNFPFVIIPSDATLDSVRKNTPFLFLSIIASMSISDPPIQRQLGEEVRIQIHRRMLLGFESSLELLQGLLVNLSWHYYFVFPHKQQMLLLSQLCVTLVYQLELDKNPKNKKRRINLEHRDHEQDEIDDSSTARVRAMLGAYYLSSSFATSFRTRSTMPYTKYMEQCCLSLAQEKEFSTDELIWHFVHNQKLSRRISDTFSYDDLDNTEYRGDRITDITAKAFLNDLDHLQRVVPRILQDNIILNLEFLLLRYWIHEVAHHGEFWETPEADTSSSLEMPSISVGRMKMLWDSLQSCKAFLERFISHPDSEIPFLTYPIMSKVCYAIMTLAKMAFLNLGEPCENNSQLATELEITQPVNHRVWNLGVTARDVELPALAGQVQEKFMANATDTVSADGEPDAMTIMSLGLGNVMSGFNKKMKELQTSMHAKAAAAPTPVSTMVQSQIETDMDSAVLPGANAINSDYYGSAGFWHQGQDPTLQLDIFEDTVWERLLDDFILP